MEKSFYRTVLEQQANIRKNYYRLCIAYAWDNKPAEPTDEEMIDYSERLESVYLGSSVELAIGSIADALVEHGLEYTDSEIAEFVLNAQY